MNSFRNLVLPLSLCALAACEQQDAISPASDASAVVLNRGNGGEPSTLDPHRTEDDGGANILRDLYEGLTSEGVAGEIVPGTAESWEIGTNGLIYTFALREDARRYR